MTEIVDQTRSQVDATPARSVDVGDETDPKRLTLKVEVNAWQDSLLIDGSLRRRWNHDDIGEVEVEVGRLGDADYIAELRETLEKAIKEVSAWTSDDLVRTASRPPLPQLR